MRVLIFAMLAIAAVMLRTEGLSTELPTWCQPNSVYSASADDIYSGGTCYCNNDGSIGNCHTVYSGANFSYTQTSSDKRGNLGMCLADGTCFKVPRTKDLPNAQCQALVAPSRCTAELDGRTWNFYIGADDDVVDGSVAVNGITYEILPVVSNGGRRVYL